MADGNGRPATAGDVLRGRGVRISLARTIRDGDGPYEPVFDSAGGPELEDVWLRFSLDVLVDVDAEHGSGPKLLEALTGETPAAAVMWCLTRMTGRAPADIGAAVLESDFSQVSIALQMAYLLAQGVDPLQVARSYSAACDVVADKLAEVQAQVAEMDMEQMIRQAADGETNENGKKMAGSRGKSGTGSGRRQAAPTASSGT